MHPILIAGAALVGLPILLHLIMKQEPKRLLFPAFRFLKQKLKTNQRKLRLRHLLLLALRVLLIALFCLVLYQPRLYSERGDSLAVVVVIDTSPSMGYAVRTADSQSQLATRLQDACSQALALVDGLPEDSQVAVVETGSPGGDWVSREVARSKIQEIAERGKQMSEPHGPQAAATPVTATLATAYGLFHDARVNTEAAGPVPRFVAIFTDRAAACWDMGQIEELKQLRDAVPGRKPNHMVIDVGVEHPANVGITAVDMSPQVLPPGQAAEVVVSVTASGLDATAVVEAYLDPARPNERATDTRSVTLRAGDSQPVRFKFDQLTPGLHQVKFRLATDDALMVDNTRFLTFRVAEPREPGRGVLAIADRPEDALFWAAAVRAKGEYGCEIVTPAQVRLEGEEPVVVRPDPMKPGAEIRDPLSAYEVVCLVSVASPNAVAPGGDASPLWPKLERYVASGKNLVIIPGGERTKLEDYDPGVVPGIAPFMPAKIKGVIDTHTLPAPKEGEGKADRRRGVRWSVDRPGDLDHPMLAPFREWKQKAGESFYQFLAPAWKYWAIEPLPGSRVVARYDDADDPASRRPAVVEREVPAPGSRSGKARVLLLTTRMDYPPDGERWNDYWTSSGGWPVVFPYLVMRYLAGEVAEANFNYTTGDRITVPVARVLDRKRETLYLGRPDEPGGDRSLEPATEGVLQLDATEAKLGPPLTLAPGNFVVKRAEGNWREGFSLNIPGEESKLDKVDAAAIEELTGPGSIGAQVPKLPQPVPLAPWLLIAVLLLLVIESFLANRFYRRPR